MQTRSTKMWFWILGFSLVLAFGSFSAADDTPPGVAKPPVDPGVRGGFSGGGGPLPGLTADELTLFNQGLDVFLEIDSVSGAIPNTGGGLGPRFNGNSCSSCHAQPAVGGTSPFVNPQVALAGLQGALNVVPFFITSNGPVREARFKSDGGVHDLYTITGRFDAVGCNIAQPDFSAAAAQNNLIFRIPTPIFGGGLIEAIPDSAIIANMNANSSIKRSLGIGGQPNRSGNDGTITRFGWKAQNKSLMIFAGEAYNVEMGVTNQLFGKERDETPGCLFNQLPEDETTLGGGVVALSDIELFSFFMGFSAPPAPAPDTPSIANGRMLFNQVGCGYCHNPSFTTGNTSSKALSNQPVNLYSDLLVHNMGTGLADGITQGSATGSYFRTAPLWGVGQRIFFLHDGRTNNILQAIGYHSSSSSEAFNVIYNFSRLRTSQQQDILNFLRSL